MKNSNHLLLYKTTTEQSRLLFSKQKELDPSVTSQVEAALSCTRTETAGGSSRAGLAAGWLWKIRNLPFAPWKDKEFVTERL